MKIFENKDVIVINKPAGIAVHGLGTDHAGTLLEEVLKLTKGKLSSLAGEERPGVVHRLDKDTSGVIIFAKTDFAYGWLIDQWKEHEVLKTYFTLIAGKLEPAKGAIDAPLGRTFNHRKKMGVMPSEDLGKNAYTEYEVQEYLAGSTLVKAIPKTGRTHQIRVHFKAINHPVIGDIQYGIRKLNKKFAQEYGLRRQFLHAASLELRLPGTTKKRAFKAPLPNDLENCLSLLRG